MPSTANERFTRSIQTVLDAEVHIAALVSAGSLTEDDADVAFEGLFLRAVTAFEAYLEAYFSQILDLTHTAADIQTALTFRSSADREKIILQGKNYADWLPYSRTVDRAKLYLKDGRPFTLLNESLKGELSKVVVIRNAIAHSSTFSISEFGTEVIGSTQLPPKERKPAGFLRGKVRRSPAESRFSAYVRTLVRVSQAIDH